MSTASIVHVLLGLVAVIIGSAILALRKGDRRHRVLGWLYIGCLLTSLTAIIARSFSHPTPFHGYAAVVMGGLMAAILASRFRNRLLAWRSWHAALMSFSMLGAAVAIGGVVGGVALGVGKGPAYYRNVQRGDCLRYRGWLMDHRYTPNRLGSVGCAGTAQGPSPV